MRPTNSTKVFLEAALVERSINVKKLEEQMADVHLLVNTSVYYSRQKPRQPASHNKLAKFTIGDFMLVARESFNAGEELVPR